LEQNTLCLGLVGGEKFCLKPKAGIGCCDAASHILRRFAPGDATLYIKENEIRAWCLPAFRAVLLTRDQISFLLCYRLPKEAWISTFEAFEENTLPDWISKPVKPSSGCPRRMLR
jgi:hypothetical protein